MILEMTRPVQGGLRQERKLDTVSNNMANVDTVGFKKDVVSFDRAFKAQLNKDFSQGDIKTTGNPFDLALGGDGFFKVETENGIHYTRNGNFSLSNEGILVDMNGFPVMGQGGAIAIDIENIRDQAPIVNEAGEVFVDGEVVDILDIVTFENRDNLEKIAQNLMVYTGDGAADEQPVANPVVKQMALEGSNVSAVDEMVKMIDYHRMFETFTKSMMTFDEVDAKAISDVGRPV